jgi:hypothetical protein
MGNPKGGYLMSVGNQLTSDQFNSRLTSLALQLREWAHDVSSLSTNINGQDTGLAVLEAAGFGSSPNAANPGDVSDAALAQNMLSYLNTVASLYYGEATQPSTFNFDQELSQLWAGQ